MFEENTDMVMDNNILKNVPQFRNQKQQLTNIFLELKSICKINENKMSEETVCGMGESPCQINIWQSVNIARLYKELNRLYTRN